jgi:chromosome segregation ATPase
MRMNSLELTSELRQIIESDIQLRKEYESLRKAMNEYRNQLIASEELCKRQDVSIEVLKTKLENQGKELAMYKGEVEAFRELRDNFKNQLEEKNSVIQNLQNSCLELEDKIRQLEDIYAQEKNRLMEEFSRKFDLLNAEWEERMLMKENEISGVRNKVESEYLERIRHFEDVLSRLSAEKDKEWTEKVASLNEKHRSEMDRLLAEEMNKWQLRYEQREKELNELISARENEVNELKNRLDALSKEYGKLLDTKETEFKNKIEEELNQWNSILSSKEEEIKRLNLSLRDLQGNMEGMKELYSAKESEWQVKHNELEARLQNVSDEFKKIYDEKIKDLESIHQSEKKLLIQQHEEHILNLKTEFEQKFSNLIVHAQSQKDSLQNELNLKSEELEKILQHLSEKDALIENLNKEINALKIESELLKTKNFELMELNAGTLFQEEEKINKIKEEFEKVITEKDRQIRSLEEGQENMAGIMENFINELNLKENHIKEINETLIVRDRELAELKKSLSDFSTQKEVEKKDLVAHYESKLSEFGKEIEKTEEKYNHILKEKENEFLKLLTENENLIREIESWEEKYAGIYSEHELLRTELEELKIKTEGRIREWKDILDAKNFEITNLQADVAGLKNLLEKLENENKDLTVKLSESSSVKHQWDMLKAEKDNIEQIYLSIQSDYNTLNTQLTSVLDENSKLKSELDELRSQTKTYKRTDEEERFIRKLFRQIDLLNSEKLSLLEEKEKMADQLLKMNEILENLSQNIDIQQVDTKHLNDHRKNVILATQNKSSGEGLKEKINELLYEIDKCIQLLG